MRQVTAILVLLVVLAVATPLPAQRVDYITDEESDLIRDAQGLELRVPALLKLADYRLVALGLRELTDKERNQIKKDIEQYETEARLAAKLKIQDIEVRAKPLNPVVYLRNFPRTELLHGYMQVIDEAMDNIDDAFDRRLEVRPSVEELQKFVRTHLPLLHKFVPKTERAERETAVIAATIEHSEQSLDTIGEALRLLPKTEKKSPAP
jgi:hypothetical protein